MLTPQNNLNKIESCYAIIFYWPWQTTKQISSCWGHTVFNGILAEQQLIPLSISTSYIIVFTVCYNRSRNISIIDVLLHLSKKNMFIAFAQIHCSIQYAHFRCDQYPVRSFLFCPQTDNLSNISEVIVVVVFPYRVSLIQLTFFSSVSYGLMDSASILMFYFP